MSISSKSIVKWCFIGLLITGLAILTHRYGFGLYQISTHAMEETLYPGEYILVNKLPVKNNPGRNRVILFSSPLKKDTASTALFLSRCIGMPGDTIEVAEDGYRINGRLVPYAPQLLQAYSVKKGFVNDFLKIAHRMNIPIREKKEEVAGISLSLTAFEAYQLREEIPEAMDSCFIRQPIVSYKLIVPRKERAYRLDKNALIACKEAISNQEGEKAVFKDNRLFLDGREVSFFFFKEDYYWMLSDNTNESIDSRHLGFIPRSRIVGNALFCWLSPDIRRFFKPIS